MSARDAGAAAVEAAIKVLDDHRRGDSQKDCLEGVGWVWACWCDCGWHGRNRDHEAHVAEALAAANLLAAPVPTGTAHEKPLPSAIEALADELQREADAANARRSLAEGMAVRRVSHRLRAVLARHDTGSGQ